MKKCTVVLLVLALFCCVQSVAWAAELLDVKPIVDGSAVTVEVTSDIAMTYTYYKVPGQARAVVDIAEADPEKVEPLIVVNKGIVASISVDKAQISGIVVSRIIFNLVSETDIAVTATPDRKKLLVTFGAATPAAKTEPKPEPKPEVKIEAPPVAVPVPVAAPAPIEKIEAPAKPDAAKAAAKEEDPLGLDEPAAKTEAAPAKTVAAPVAVAAAAVAVAAPAVTRVPKLEPVVPAATAPQKQTALSILDIATGASYIDIRANQSVANYKTTKLSGPDRLVIDIPCEKVNQKAKTVAINKFGIAKARIGISPKNVRIVIDASKAGFPAHTISTIEDGIRVSFK